MFALGAASTGLVAVQIRHTAEGPDRERFEVAVDHRLYRAAEDATGV